MDKNKIEIIDGEKCYVLPEHSYVSWLYEESRGDVSYNYSYIRLPVPGSTTVYENRYVTHVHMRDDVRISTYIVKTCQYMYQIMSTTFYVIF